MAEQWDGRAFAEEVARRLDAPARAGGATVVGWRFELGAGRSLRVGVKDGRIGGPYEPPSFALGIGGSLYLRWSDGLVAHGNLDAAALEEWEERLATWRAGAYRDPDAPEIPAPQPLPSVETADPNVVQAVTGAPDPLFAWLAEALGRLRAAGVAQVDAGAGASAGDRFVFTSTGLRAAHPETGCTFWVSGEDLYGQGYRKRRLPRPEEVEFVVADVVETVPALRTEDRAPSGPLPVLLPADVFEAFLGTFVGANLSGRAVLEGTSAWTLEDFRGGRQVLREDLDLVVDTLLPLELAASPVSGEGVPGGRAELIRAGRLVTPLLDLKYARRAGLPPTPAPGGPPGLLLRPAGPLPSAAELIAEIELGLLVYAVMGLHTQDPATGSFSLVAPQSRVIRDGKLGGKVKAVLAGNFHAALRDPASRFATFPYELNPGLLLTCRVTV